MEYLFKYNGEVLVVGEGLRDQYDGEFYGFNKLLDSMMVANLIFDLHENNGEWIEYEDMFIWGEYDV